MLREKKGCRFKAKSNIVADRVLTKILTVEDSVEFAKSAEACAYYGFRQALGDADFVLVPYSCVLHRGTRER